MCESMSAVNEAEVVTVVRSEDFSPQKLMRTKVLTTNLYVPYFLEFTNNYAISHLSVFTIFPNYF